MASTVTDATRRDLGETADLIAAGVITPFGVVKTALRGELDGVDELLAHVASGGTRTVAEILAVASAVGAGTPVERQTLEGLTGPAVSALAFLTIGRGLDAESTTRAADLFALARRLGQAAHPDLDLQVQLAAGRLRPDSVKAALRAPGLDPWVAWAARADLVNPFPDPDPETLGTWYDVFDEPFVARGIDPVRVTDVSRPFQSLTASRGPSAAGTVDGPLVSIVVPVYASGPDLLTAVGSIVGQTWGNLQVILVDDASPDEQRDVIEQAVALDDRVELVRLPVNGGAYVARNAGIARARGEIVGIQDSDDWTHPERIARQMALLDADPRLMATLSKAVRLHTDLRITKVGSLPFERNLPSLLFRREQVLQRLGRFDDVRKAADTEFVARIAATFGPASVRTLEEPLALYQLTEGSLSREDFRIGWHRHTRVSYHSAYRHWHRRIAAGTSDPRLDDTTGRRFPAPPELRAEPYPGRLDVVLLADTRDGGLGSTGLPEEVRAVAATGATVGLTRAEPMRLAAVNRGYPLPAVSQVVAEGLASWVPLVADVEAGLLVVRDPDLVAWPRRDGTVQLRADRVVVVADRLPEPSGSPRVSYDPATVEQSVRDLFGAPTEWLPATAVVAEALVAHGARGLVHDPQPAEVVRVAPHPERPVVGRPVIGVVDDSRFAAERLGAGRLRTLPTDAAHDVRVVVPTGKRLPTPWLAYDTATLTHHELLDQCDVVVGPPGAVAGPNGLRPVLEGMARGCVAVVDPVHEPLLGAAALYLDGRGVADVVDPLWADPEAWAAQQRLSLDFCRERLSAETYASAITRIRSTP